MPSVQEASYFSSKDLGGHPRKILYRGVSGGWGKHQQKAKQKKPNTNSPTNLDENSLSGLGSFITFYTLYMLKPHLDKNCRTELKELKDKETIMLFSRLEIRIALEWQLYSYIMSFRYF